MGLILFCTASAGVVAFLLFKKERIHVRIAIALGTSGFLTLLIFALFS